MARLNTAAQTHAAGQERWDYPCHTLSTPCAFPNDLLLSAAGGERGAGTRAPALRHPKEPTALAAARPRGTLGRGREELLQPRSCGS